MRETVTVRGAAIIVLIILALSISATVLVNGVSRTLEEAEHISHHKSLFPREVYTMGDHGAYDYLGEQTFRYEPSHMHGRSPSFPNQPTHGGFDNPNGGHIVDPSGYDEMFDGAVARAVNRAPVPHHMLPKSVSQMRGKVDFTQQGMMDTGQYHDRNYRESDFNEQALRRRHKAPLQRTNPHITGGGQKIMHGYV